MTVNPLNLFFITLNPNQLGGRIMTIISSAKHTLTQTSKKQSHMMAILSCWKKMNEQRQYLRSLKPYLLNDIGISQQQALKSAKNPFWQ